MSQAADYAWSAQYQIPPGTAPGSTCRKTVVGEAGYGAWFRDGSFLLKLRDGGTVYYHVEDADGSRGVREERV